MPAARIAGEVAQATTIEAEKGVHQGVEAEAHGLGHMQHAGFQWAKEDCLAHVERVWTDMRPLSLRG
ncbi:hypothetical protein BKA18_000488 [Streptomyces auratus]